MSFRTILILINVVALAGDRSAIIGYRVAPAAAQPGAAGPQNLTPFFDDDVLEGRAPRACARLGADRSLVVVVLGLLAYCHLGALRRRPRPTGFDERVGRARRDALRQRAVEGATTARSRCCAPTATAPTAVAAPRPSW